MLTRDALESALPLTEALDRADLYLEPIPNTPLAALVMATRSDNNVVITNDAGYVPDIGNIEYIANVKDEVLGFSQHEKVMDEIVEVACQAVQGHIHFARTVVSPLVQDLAERVQQSLNDIAKGSLLGMEVIVWNPPSPLANSALETSVRRFEEVPYDPPALNMKLPSLTAPEILDLMASGSSGLDGDVRDWAAEKGESYFLQLWENVFQQKQAALNDTRVKTFGDYLNCPKEGIDNTLAIYLIARRLTDEPIEGVEMPLALFNRSIVEFRNQAGRALVYILDDLDRASKGGILVRSTTERTVTVNGNLYRGWIEAGGENEVLFGNLLDLPGVITIEALNSKATLLKSTWNKHLALTNTVEANRRFNRTKELLERHFHQQLVSETEEDPTVLANREEVLKRFRASLRTVSEADMKDLYALCLCLICQARFPQTDAERILAGIERVKKDNPQIDVREAAAISVLDYVAYWVGSQYRVTAV